MLGTGECNVEASVAAGLGERPEVMADLSFFIRAVADAEEDHVTLVALHAFQVLDEDRFAIDRAFLAEVLFDFRVGSACLLEALQDDLALRQAESDNPVGKFRAILGLDAAQELIDQGFCFDGIGARFALIIDGVRQVFQRYAEAAGVLRREGQ
jgi:hypothetical protein